ncbi:ABC transporter permease [Psychrobacillus sp. FSL K6-4615]|uniref:ABC transporter permease n=1 Tax=Psychrobacillus sp. FSL K6-4615 TaxID=2921551 RepID=UPI0030F52C7B
MKKSNENFYEQVQQNRLYFLILSMIAVVFTTGATFTLVIPGLNGFNLYLTIIIVAFYFLIANMYVGLFKGRLYFVFTISLILSSLGMGWGLWLEWGEVSLVEHMNPVVIIGYPCIVAFIISLMYQLSTIFLLKRINF